MFKIGADPELFAVDGDGRYVSSHDIIPGTKAAPHFVECGAIQVDGVAFEYNIFPADDAETFLFFNRRVQDQMASIMKSVRPDLELVHTPTAWFSPAYFNSLPDEAKLLGCTPDFNAWTGEQNDPPGTSEPFRTGGGHIHIGWGEYLDPDNEDHFDLCRRVVKQLDTILYPLSMEWDSDSKRRELYGNMGAFRPKTYGVEYRPLSNAWTKDDEIIKEVFNVTIDACTRLFRGEELWMREAA